MKAVLEILKSGLDIPIKSKEEKLQVYLEINKATESMLNEQESNEKIYIEKSQRRVSSLLHSREDSLATWWHPQADAA